MKTTGLSEAEMSLICRSLSSHQDVSGAILFGSRAKGTSSPSSDIDLALEGVENEIRAEAIANDLEELPLPYRFDVKAISSIEYAPLREHIERVGIRIYGD